MKPEDQLKNHYNPRLEQFSDNFKILDWESRDAQFARFRVLSENIELRDKSLLDVGCGCGDLFQMLKEELVPVDYTGIDILPGMIEKAGRLHDDGTFVCGDLFKDPSICRKSYQIVFTSGIFNLNLGNNDDFFRSAVTGLTGLAMENIVINLLDEASPNRDENYFYFNPEDAALVLKKAGWNVRIIREYLNNDFTLIGTARECS